MKANIDLIMVCAGSQGPADKMHVPLGLIYIGSELQRNGYNVKIWHLMGDEIENALPDIRSRQPLWIGLSVLSGMTTPLAAVYSRRLREELPDTPIVWGGHHPSALPEDCLRESYVDYVVVGEAEDAAVEFSDVLLKKSELATIRNLGYCDRDGNPVVNPIRPLEENLDRYDLNWELVDLSSYMNQSAHGKKSISFYSSRGCPYKCAFCVTPLYTGSKYRMHSPEFVVHHLRYLKETHGFNSVYFADDNFVIDKKRALEIIEQLGRIDVSVDTLDVRLDQLDENLLTEFSRLNVNGLFFGWESGNDRILSLMNKGITLKQIVEKVRLIKRYNITTWASGIIGIPTETREEIYHTIDFSMWLRDNLPNGSTVSTYRYMPLPKTRLLQLAVADGFTLPTQQEDWRKIDPIGPYYEMPWLKWVTDEDEQFFAFAQELSRNQMLSMISSRYRPWEVAYNFFVKRMRNKISKRQNTVDLEFKCFVLMRNTAYLLRYGKNPFIESQVLSH